MLRLIEGGLRGLLLDNENEGRSVCVFGGESWVFTGCGLHVVVLNAGIINAIVGSCAR
jgi:hypothetical protein